MSQCKPGETFRGLTIKPPSFPNPVVERSAGKNILYGKQDFHGQLYGVIPYLL
ncbi:hypothetical protein [Legionella sp. W05-934-2]|uniref:hypothetical protein n=1 Tax=Legionella sp. W05-934-2 TaxID=1198649 RepID=UPI003461D4D5